MFLFFWIILCITFWILEMHFDFHTDERLGMDDPSLKKNQKKKSIFSFLFFVCLIAPFLFYFITGNLEEALFFFWIGLSIIFFILNMVFVVLLCRCERKYGKENALYKKYRKNQFIFGFLFLVCFWSPFFYYLILEDAEKLLIGFSILFIVSGVVYDFLSQCCGKKNGMEDALYKKYRKGLGISFALFAVCFVGSLFVPEKADPVSEEKVASLENNVDEDQELEQKEPKDFSEESKEPETEKINTSEEQKEPEEDKVTSSEEPQKAETEELPPSEEPKEAEKEVVPPEEVQKPVQSEISGKEKRKQELEDFKTGLVENSDGGIISVEEYNEGIFQMTVSNAWYLLSDSEKQYFAEEMYSKFILYGKYAYDMDFISFTIYSESSKILAKSTLMGGMEIKE